VRGRRIRAYSIHRACGVRLLVGAQAGVGFVVVANCGQRLRALPASFRDNFAWKQVRHTEIPPSHGKINFVVAHKQAYQGTMYLRSPFVDHTLRSF